MATSGLGRVPRPHVASKQATMAPFHGVSTEDGQEPRYPYANKLDLCVRRMAASLYRHAVPPRNSQPIAVYG